MTRPAQALRAVACVFGAGALLLLLFASPAGAAFFTPEYETTWAGAGDHEIAEPLAVAVDEATHDVYVADRTKQQVVKFDASGSFLLRFGSFPNPSSIAVDNSSGPSQGSVYVAEGSASGGGDKIFKFDGSGQPVVSWGVQGVLTVKAVRKVTVSPFDGRVWVLDGSTGESPGSTDGGHLAPYTENGVQEFRVEQRNSFGGDGTAAVDADDRLWFSNHNGVPLVLDVTRYGETGNHPLGIIQPGTASHFAVNPANSDVLAVFNESEVRIFDVSCDPSREFCEPKDTFGGGILNGPKGLAIDGETGSVYVAVSGGVAVFRSKVVPDVIPKPADVGATDALLTAHIDPVGAGDVTGCVVEYGSSPFYGETAPCDQTLPFGSPTDATVHLSNLDTESTYHYRFRATNANGTSNGPDRAFTPHWVAGLETGPASEIEAGSAILHGELDPAGETTHYYFEWGTTKSYGRVTPTLPGGQTSATGLTPVETSLTGLLTSNTTYHYRLVGVNSLGASFGFDRQFTTPTGAAPQIGAVSATPTGESSARLQATINPGFAPTAYRFQLGTHPSSLERSTVIGPPFGDDGTFHTVSEEIEGLNPATTYYYRVIAFNFLERVTSATEDFTTPGPALGPPLVPSGTPTAPVLTAPLGPEPARRCKKGFVKKKGKCVKKHQRGKHKRGGRR